MSKLRILLGVSVLSLLPLTPVQADMVDPLENIDSDMRAVLAAQASFGYTPIETLGVAEARLQPTPADGAKLVMKARGMDPTDDMGVLTRDIKTDSGVKVRVYYPKKMEAPLPVVVYYHGGGFVIADLDTYDATPRETAKNLNAIVVAVEYRHAPEFKFPAAHDDAFAAYKWVVATAKSWGGDPQRIAVMGESAGGNLAINTSIAARDAHIQMPVYQALIYPLASVDLNSKSYTENATAKPLNKAMMTWFFRNLVRDRKDLADPRLNLTGNANLAGLPPTTIVTAAIDPLRSDGHMLAMRLKQAGVEVHSANYKGVTHEFFGMGAVVKKAADAEDFVNDDLSDALGR